MSYADIAQFLGITETAVQGRLQRARLQLREELKMVKEHFESEGLPDNFSEAIQRLLNEAGKSKVSWEASLKSEHPLMRIAGISTAAWQGVVPPLDVCVAAFVRCAKDSRRPKINWGYGALRLIDRHGEEGQKALRKVMDEGHSDLKALAAVSDSMRKTEEAFDLLTQVFLGGHRDRRWVSGFWRPLGNFHRRALVDWVVEKGDLLAEVPAPLWALALSKKSFERVHLTIERLFEIGTPSVREACVRILARQKGVAVLPVLRDCLAKGKPTRVARRAFHEMREMGDDAVSTAQDMFESELWTERRAAVGLLKYWKKLTPEQMQQAKDDAHIGVREAMIR